MKKAMTAAALLGSAFMLGACSQQATETSSATAEESKEIAASLPDDLFITEAPSDPITVSQARANAKAGDDIVMTGYIGGREKPFTAGRALFLMADSEKAPACTDTCPIPWDACCTASEVVAANSATVQVLDSEGRTLKTDLNGANGLAPGAEITVVGKVREANESLLIVDAQGIIAAAQ